jgi:hypothetical protein
MPAIESEVVLLASAAVLAQLLALWPASTFRKAGRPDVQPPPAPPGPTSPRHAQSLPREEPEQTRPYRSRICSCGACGQCQDNARWNRIFDEKFADPSYYGRISVRHNSSLAGI